MVVGECERGREKGRKPILRCVIEHVTVQKKWSYFKMKPAAMPEELPYMSYASNLWNVKTRKHNLELGLGQHCVPKNYLQRQPESRYYYSWTDDYWPKILKHCLKLASRCYVIWINKNCLSSIDVIVSLPLFINTHCLCLIQTLFGLLPQSVQFLLISNKCLFFFLPLTLKGPFAYRLSSLRWTTGSECYWVPLTVIHSPSMVRKLRHFLPKLPFVVDFLALAALNQSPMC